ncbi:MAG: serine protease [Thermofilaceae archaeon]
MISVRLCGASALTESDVRALAESVAEGCCTVHLFGGLGDILGSGFQTEVGIITVRHVLEPYLVGEATLAPTSFIRIVPLKGQVAVLLDRVQMVSRNYDVAVLPRVEVLKDLPLGSSRDMKVGDDVVVLASPETVERGITAYAASGRIIATAYTTPDIVLYEIPVLPGSSGGAVVNTAGEVVAVNVMRLHLPDGRVAGAGLWVDAVKAALEGTIRKPEELEVAVGGVPWTHVVAGGVAAALVLSLLKR